MAKKKRLASGEKFYCRCESCVETWGSPAIVSYIDDVGNLRITDRQYHLHCHRSGQRHGI